MAERTKLVKEFEKGWKHFCNCIDFGGSNLDAEAIRFMNEMPGQICNSHDKLVGACKEVIATWVGLPEGSIGGQTIKKVKAALEAAGAK